MIPRLSLAHGCCSELQMNYQYKHLVGAMIVAGWDEDEGGQVRAVAGRGARAALLLSSRPEGGWARGSSDSPARAAAHGRRASNPPCCIPRCFRHRQARQSHLCAVLPLPSLPPWPLPGLRLPQRRDPSRHPVPPPPPPPHTHTHHHHPTHYCTTLHLQGPFTPLSAGPTPPPPCPPAPCLRMPGVWLPHRRDHLS